MKDKNHLLFILLIIITIILVPLINLHLIIYNEDFYKKEFYKLGGYDTFKDKSYPDRALDEILNYFKNEKYDIPKIENFDENENSHMHDVKLLIKGLIFLEIVLIYAWILLFLAFISYKIDITHQLGKILFYSSTVIIFLLIIFIITVKFAFDNAFIIFHKLFFPQGNWLFSPDSTMIKLFPQEFFSDVFIKLLVNTTITTILIFIIGALILKIRGKIYIY